MDLQSRILRAKQKLVDVHYKLNLGHVGGNLSCIDALMTIFTTMNHERDSLVLSKGHSALALYVCLWDHGLITEQQLYSYHQDGSELSGHPSPHWSKHIHFHTGSLGHGLPLSAGLAHGMCLQNKSGHVYVLMSDGEWQEGSNWESLFFIQRHHLKNLTIFIDHNQLQAFARTKQMLAIKKVKEIFKHFDFTVIEIDGHDPVACGQALHLKSHQPKLVILETIKGKGIARFEDQIESHYLPLTDDDYAQFMKRFQ